MKNLTITYQMFGPDSAAEPAEGSITLSMLPDLAADALEGNPGEALSTLLDCLAKLQGYVSAELCGVAETD